MGKTEHLLCAVGQNVSPNPTVPHPCEARILPCTLEMRHPAAREETWLMSGGSCHVWGQGSQDVNLHLTPAPPLLTSARGPQRTQAETGLEPRSCTPGPTLLLKGRAAAAGGDLLRPRCPGQAEARGGQLVLLLPHRLPGSCGIHTPSTGESAAAALWPPCLGRLSSPPGPTEPRRRNQPGVLEEKGLAEPENGSGNHSTPWTSCP